MDAPCGPFAQTLSVWLVMAEFTDKHIEEVVATCGENGTDIAESFNLCFDRKYRVAVDKSTVRPADDIEDELDTPGLVVALKVGSKGMLVLIPATLPLPDWFATPGDSEQARLQTLAMEWSIGMLPEQLQADQFATTSAENLNQALADAEPLNSATVFELQLFEQGRSTSPNEPDDVANLDASANEQASGEPAADDSEPGSDEEESDGVDEAEAESAEESAEEQTEEAEGGDAAASTDAETPDASDEQTETKNEDEDEPVARLYVVCPVANIDVVADQPASSENHNGTRGDDSAAAQPVSGIERRRARILDLPVAVSVRLAGKKIEVNQLTELTPGSLITFDKSCEDMLDLYVNNHRYCRGEAVKIGEKFGLKITQVGVVEVREQKIVPSAR